MNAAAALGADLSGLDDPEALERFTQWRIDRHGERRAESSLRLGGLHCAACAGLIEAALLRLEGVEAARVNAAAELAQVCWDPARTRASALVAAVRHAGYDAAPDLAADARALRAREQGLALWRLFVAAFCAMQVMMFAAPVYFAAPGELAPDLRQLLHWGSWVLTLPVMWFSAAPFFTGAWRALRQRRIGMDVPVALGLGVTFVASTGAAFDPGGVFGDAVYFDSLTMFVAFLLAARWLEGQARQRAAAALEGGASSLPEQALRVLGDGRTEAVALSRVAVGDRLRVPLGARFAADGVLLDGATASDESLLSGESRPQPKQAGDEVLAGSLNLGAPVEMRVTRCGVATRHAAIVALTREALMQRSALAASAERWAAPFLVAVLVLAGLAAAAWSQIDPARALWVAVSVLIVTCPCALSLAAPSAWLVAGGQLARRGVLLRRLDALDAMARVQVLCVDKTGTLTQAQPQWRGMQRLDAGAASVPLADATLLQLAASLAAWSGHPLSRALAGLAAVDASPPVRWHEVREQAGAGVAALDAQGREWRLGAAAFVGATAWSGDDDALQLWFGVGGSVLLRIDFEETLRDDAVAALAALRQQGIAVHLLSGDRPQRVQRLAARLGLVVAQASASPQDKRDAVRRLQADGQVVAMLGDGINDAPVLAQADVSLAMGEGSDLARHSADAVLLSMRLSDVAPAFALARRARRVVRQNWAWAAGYNAACIPLALAGWLPPWLAGLGMALSSLAVVGNALRLAR